MVPAAAPATAPQHTAWQGPYLDATSGRYYYHNPWTRESSWAQAPAAAPLLDGTLNGMHPATPYGMPAMPMGMPGMHPAGYPLMPLPYGYPYMPGTMAAAYGGAYGGPMAGALPLPMGGGPSSRTATSGDGAERGDGRDECGDFKRGKCDRGDSCRYAHVKPNQECRDFRAGRCTRGATCKFLHGGDVANSAPDSQKSDMTTTPRERSRSR